MQRGSAAGTIDQALVIAARPEVIFCSFGDMLRVPGSSRSLFEAKASGVDVRVVYSPLDAVKIARANPQRQVVFFAVGFETTAPANAAAVSVAAREGLDNFSILVAHVLVPPAVEAILRQPDCRVHAFLAADPLYVANEGRFTVFVPESQRKCGIIMIHILGHGYLKGEIL